jgi:acyl-CoA reductase-like NAD-dependent aldehyde dehydrogenase
MSEKKSRQTSKKSRAAQQLGRKRWAKVSPEERSRLMREAALRRWNKPAPSHNPPASTVTP